jgi:hypothetical protein
MVVGMRYSTFFFLDGWSKIFLTSANNQNMYEINEFYLSLELKGETLL